MVLTLSGLLFLILCTLTFFPALRLLYARNPAFVSMILTLSSCFLGVYLAIELSRSEEREDRMARAATLMEMAREGLSASRMEARLLEQLKQVSQLKAGSPLGSNSLKGNEPEFKPVSAQSKGLADLLNNGAVLEQISPQSLKALLASQANMERELGFLTKSTGRNRRHHLNGYLRELVFAQGVLSAEAEFQRGNIGRRDLSEILDGWTVKKSLPPI
jgi:Ca2+/Na+ antiporter